MKQKQHSMSSENCPNYPESCSRVNSNTAHWTVGSVVRGVRLVADPREATTSQRFQPRSQDLHDTVAVHHEDTDSNTAMPYTSILTLVWFTGSEERALFCFFLVAQTVVPSCTSVVHWFSEEVVRGVGRDKDREAKWKAGVLHEATRQRSHHQGCGSCCKLTTRTTT